MVLLNLYNQVRRQKSRKVGGQYNKKPQSHSVPTSEPVFRSRAHEPKRWTGSVQL